MADELSMSNLSLNSNGSQMEDWDRSLEMADVPATPPRNSVAFPGDADENATPGKRGEGKGKRSLSELLRLHAEKGTDCMFTQEEAKTVGDVLGQWINASSSPYEGEDDFFSRAQDDSAVPSPRPAPVDSRPRGKSETATRSNGADGKS
ncbi:hypothetical protein BD626DRAFT_475521 [Schizophyllum amplum]|uniref:Uncharacterized protein n=1 Tax=Schizophyllum amplum TaxID=97359 RepID=A0A550CYM3_9AGAR|nr:hypothetical protein BD626DRAFT_475521 [Auriculariopsis ampla]